MRTLADATILAAFCGLLWLVVRPLTRAAAGHALLQMVLYAVAVAVTTAAAVALGARREDLDPSVRSIAATAGGMAAFWLLVRLQTRTRPERSGVETSDRDAPPPAPLAETRPAEGDVLPVTRTRRERREARRGLGRLRRRTTAAVR
jgi:hypothetical protein